MTDEPFTPHADSIQTAWVLMCQQSRVSTQPPVEELEAEFDRFLARVRRDAAREALCGLRESHAQTVSILAADSQARFYEEKILLRIDRYRETHHPEKED